MAAASRNPLDLPPYRDDRTVGRTSVYFLVFLALFVGAATRGPGLAVGPGFYSHLHVLTTFVALMVGALALVRFYSKKQGEFLFLGTGFLGTFFLDSFHAAVSAGLLGPWSDEERAHVASWSFSASATFLGLFLLVSYLSWRREAAGKEQEPLREGPVYLTALLLTALIFGLFLVFFDLFPVTEALYPELAVHQPAEWVAAFFFLTALVGYLAKGHWRVEILEHWLVLALLLSFMAHGAYMAFAAGPGDGKFVLAQLLKLAGYGAVLVGLLSNVYVTYRREEAASEATREANAALAREVDIRRRAEKVLQESEERLQDFLDNAHDLIQSIAPDGRILYVNRAWETTLGYRGDELKGLNFFDLLHPSCRENCRQRLQSVLSGQPVPDIELELLAKDGRVVRCRGSANARIQDGVAVAIRSIFRDVSQEVEARRALSAFQANLQALVENTGDWIWSVDRSFRLITFNTAFSMALEVSLGRAPKVGDTPEDCFAPHDASWYREMYGKALKGAAFSELRDEEIAGQVRSFEFSFNPIREAGGITGVAVFGRDVTARRRTQLALRMAKEEAERANRAKSQFLANMSHELRTPLNSVIGFTNILLKNRGGNLTEQDLVFLERISANGRHLLQLINEILDLAKIESGRIEVEWQEIDLGELVEQTLAQLEGQVRDKPVVLRAEVPPGLAPFRTDPAKLKQVLINLVGNAIKFTEQGEVVVRVRVGADGGRPTAIQVQDTGIGIPADRLGAVFEAFQQADDSTSRKYGGTGLGLTISRSLCELMGYQLTVASEVGKGSVFTIHLFQTPARSRPEEELEEEGGMVAARGSRLLGGEEGPAGVGTLLGRAPKVLVIEDDPDSRMLVAHHLEELGCRVLEAASVSEGLRIAREQAVDLVTLDLMMPGRTGWSALREFKDDLALRGIPVIIVSVLGEKGERGGLWRAADILAKPVEKEHLERALRRLLDPARRRTILVVEEEGAPSEEGWVEELERAGYKVLCRPSLEQAEEELGGDLDGVVLDVKGEVDRVQGFLAHGRMQKGCSGLPIFVSVAPEAEAEFRQRLQALASMVLPRTPGYRRQLLRLLALAIPPTWAPATAAEQGSSLRIGE